MIEERIFRKLWKVKSMRADQISCAKHAARCKNRARGRIRGYTCGKWTLKEKWKQLMNISKGNKKLIRYALHNLKATRIVKKRSD